MVCNSSMKTISVGNDFSDTPMGRYPTDGGFSGERFREEVLVPALSSEDVVHVVIDDAEGYGSSFLEEAFGGLVRKGYHNAAALKKKLIIDLKNTDYELYRSLIWKYISEAKSPTS